MRLRPAGLLVLAFASGPMPAHAHDAFGDLGPFYASLLHPLVDPLQAVLLVGIAAFLAGRSHASVRIAFPVFIVMAACSHVFLGWLGGVSATPFIAALAAIVAGILSTLPDRWLPRWADVLIVAALGAVVGLIPDGQALSDGAIQSILGTILGIAILPALIWAALEGVARRVSQIVPAVAGSWVAAVGILIATISS